jgi:hypothetical protein
MRKFLIWATAAAVLFFGARQLIYSGMRAEGFSGNRSVAYAAALDQDLLAWALANPQAPAVRRGFWTNDVEHRPCTMTPAEFAVASNGYSDVGCTAVSVGADVLPDWAAWFLPNRVVIRVSPIIWSDAKARAAILRLARSRPAVCAAIRATTVGTIQGSQARAVGCEPYHPMRLQVWVNVMPNPFVACREGLPKGQLYCGAPSMEEPGAVRLS